MMPESLGSIHITSGDVRAQLDPDATDATALRRALV